MYGHTHSSNSEPFINIYMYAVVYRQLRCNNTFTPRRPSSSSSSLQLLLPFLSTVFRYTYTESVNRERGKGERERERFATKFYIKLCYVIILKL